MTFAHPWLLLLLLLLPLLAWLKGRRGQPPAFVYSSVQLVRPVLNVTRTRSGAVLAALRWLALAAGIVALAQPRIAHTESRVKASGIDIALAIDLSGSMEVPDYVYHGTRVNRLDLAKDVMAKFIEKRPSDRMGLVAFGGRAYIASPLTLDHDFLLTNLGRLKLHTIEDNTAIGSGLATCINRLRDLKSKSKIVILMTDGQNNAGSISPMSAAEAAKALGIKVYTIGLGNADIVRQMRLPRDYLPDDDTLQQIATLTGGKYYRADNSEKLQSIYAEIDKLEKTEAEMHKFERFDELFPYCVTAVLGLLLIELILSQTVLRRIP
ncbi:MAG: VWA domain-containing protein [Verrucomicrobiota bacterium]